LILGDKKKNYELSFCGVGPRGWGEGREIDLKVTGRCQGFDFWRGRGEILVFFIILSLKFPPIFLLVARR